jgi:hypothetical protein
MSKFMVKLEESLRSRGLADSSAKSYILQMKRLNDGKQFTSFAFLKDIPAVEAIIEKSADNTQKNYYAAILSCTKEQATKSTYAKAIKYYARKFEGLKETIEAQVKTNDKTETQKENWLTWKEVLEVRDALQKEVDAIVLPEDGKIGVVEYDLILRNVILALYTYIPPRRNKDYMLMKITKLKGAESMPTNQNYYDILNQRFIFNTFKTSKTYGQQIVSIKNNKGLLKAIDVYLDVHQNPKDDMSSFLCHYGGIPFQYDFDITRNLNRTFKKNIGATMLRHIFISDMYDVDDIKEKAKERNDLANAMAHSVTVQQDYMKH